MSKEAFKRLLRQEEHAETARIGDHVAGTDGVDEFRRQDDADDFQVPLAAVHDGREAVPRPEAMGVGECLDHRDFLIASGLRKSPAAQIELVD